MKLLKKIFFLPILPIILISIFGSLLKINIIHCQISETNCGPDLYKHLESLKGESLFFINFDKKLEENGPYSETMLFQSYKKQFPGTIFLKFTEEKISYQFNFEEKKAFISEFGNILQNNQGVDSLTQVNWNTDLSNETHSKIIRILESVAKTNLKIEKITKKNDREIIIKASNSPKVIVDDNSIDTKIDMLGILLDSREIKEYEEPIKEIDLRFNLPVLRTTQ